MSRQFWLIASLCGISVCMATLSWNRWADPLVDFGREVYVPWQITQGAMLYRDVASFNGPLAPYFNAALFLIFGVHLSTLIICNLCLIAALALFFFFFFARLFDEGTGFLCAAVFLLLFAMSHYIVTANYNFVTPYSYDLTYGFALSCVGFCLLLSYSRRPNLKKLALAGCISGLVLLTKIEIVVAYVPALLVFAFLNRSRSTWRSVTIFCASALVPILLSFALFSTAPLRSYRALASHTLDHSVFYATEMGTVSLWSHIYQILFMSCVWTIIAFIALGITRFGSRIAAIIFSLLYCAFMLHIDAPHLLLMFSPLPFIPLIVLFKQRRIHEAYRALWIAWNVFAELLLLKILFDAKIYHYGFVLALPATLSLVVLLRSLHRRASIVLIGGIAAAYLTLSFHLYVAQQKSIKGHDDTLLTFNVTPAPLQETLSYLSSHLSPTDHLMVFPEGVMLNFLLRTPSSIPYVNFMPPDVALFGRDTMLASLIAHPPEFVVLIDKPLGEYGVYDISKEYGAPFISFIRDHYTLAAHIGPPLFHGTFGVEILKKQ